MAGRATADIVFCIDASESMRPVFDAVRDNVVKLVAGLQEDGQRAWDVRFDFLAYHLGMGDGNMTVFCFDSVFLTGENLVDEIYHARQKPNGGSGRFFTSDLDTLKRRLGEVKCIGDEASAVALDIAADFPFRDPAACHRVIILLTDEPIETGGVVAESESKIMDLARKVQAKGIQLFMVTPPSAAFDELSQIDKCEWTVADECGRGLSSIDFTKLLQAIGKSVSVSQVAAGAETAPRPLFGEADWESATADDFTERR